MEENTSEQNIHDEIATEEALAINSYIDKIYVLKVPVPEKPKQSDLSFFNLVGLEAFGYTLSAFSGLLLSAIRTGGLFFLLEESFLKKHNFLEYLIWVVALLAACAALGAFEVYLLIDGIKKGRKQKELKNSRLGIIVAATVVVTAGLFSSFALVEIPRDIQLFMNIIVAIITGVGSASILFLGGENIGYTLEDFQKKKKKMLLDYRNEYQAWRESGVKSYKTSQFNFNRKGGSIYSDRITQMESSRKVSNKVENNEESSKKPEDWRKVRPTLTLDQLRELANMNPNQMRDYSEKIGYTYKTLANWRTRAREELNMKDEEETTE